MAIRISVKGSAEQAREALAARGLQASLVAESPHGGTYWDVADHARAAVVTWFCEPGTCGEGGFPPGTLLHHA